MPDSIAKVTPPGFQPTLEIDSGIGHLSIPSFPARGREVTFPQWVHAVCIPTAAKSSFDAFNGTMSGAGAIVNKLTGSGTISGAFFFAIACRKKDSPSADLLTNRLALKIGGVELAVLDVVAASQKSGWMIYVPGDGGSGDTRFALSTAETNITGGAVEADTDVYTKTAHGLFTGQRVKLVSLTGGTGLTAGTVYYFSKTDADNGKLCATYADAIAGTAVAVSLDASAVVLTPNKDVGLELTQVDPNLEIHVIICGAE